MIRDTMLIKAKGISMTPLIFDGSDVVVKKKNFSSIKVDDIVAFHSHGNIIVHRVVYKASSYIIPKGDNSPVSDGKIKPEQILGKVISVHYKNIRYDINDYYLMQSSIYTREIKDVMQELDSKKIEYAFLKGLPLYLDLQGEHPRRIYADCDVLVNKKHINRAKKILVKKKYRYISQSLTKMHQKVKKNEVEHNFVKNEGIISIVFDVHEEPNFLIPQLGSLDQLYPQKKIEKLTNEFLKKKREVEMLGSKAYLLSPEHSLVMLLLHLFHHSSKGYNRYELISQLTRRKINIREVINLIEEYQLGNFVYVPLFFLNKYYKNDVISAIFMQVSVPKEVVDFAKKLSKEVIIWDDEKRIEAGIKRFRTVFFLSPMPMYSKLLVFFQPNVLNSILWVLVLKFRLLFRDISHSHNFF